MTTALQGVYTAPTCTNLSQNFSINEGTTAIDLLPFVLTTGVNYSRVYTLTMTISAPYQADSISLVCGTLNGLAFTRVGNVYTLSSEYTAANGVKINNWAYFKIALQSINISLSNSDFSDSFTVTSVLTDGSTTLTGVINVYTQAQADVVGNNQFLYTTMATNSKSLADLGGINLAIADPAQANKTYRVTLTVVEPEGSYFYITVKQTALSFDSGWQKSIVLSGTQAYINSLLTPTVGDYASGLCVLNYAPDFSGTVTVNYLQEVLTTNEAVAVPYVQEGGTLFVDMQYTPPMTLNSLVNYTEDSSVTFDLGNITDLAGANWSYETCGLYQGHNCYTLTATALGSYTAENPVVLTYAGDTAVSNSVTFTGTRDEVNAAINALTLIPPADHVGQINIGVVLTRGNTPVTILESVVPAICNVTHGDVNIINGSGFTVGTTSVNFGSITDLAVGKQYTVTIDAVSNSATRGYLTDTTGTGVWTAAGGVNSFGSMTISGSKAVVNASLAALTYTTAVGADGSETQTFVYTQTQTTNAVLQGTVNITFTNSIVWSSGNGVNAGQNAFVYDQDKTVTYDLASLSTAAFDDVTTYTAKLIFSTPLSTANLGSVTDWTRETDYIWTKTGLRADLNTALAAVAFNPPAQLVSNFTLDIAIWAAGTPIKDTATLGSTKTVYLRNLAYVTWTPAALEFDQENVTTWELATLSSAYDSRTYTLRLVTNTATGSSITGWTTVNSTTFERTGTGAQLQSALSALEFNPIFALITNFTFTLQAYRSSLLIYTTPTTKLIQIGNLYAVEIPPYSYNYNQDTVLNLSLGTLSSAFNNTDTYTVILTAKQTSTGNLIPVGNVGSFAGWSTSGGYEFTKTGTKAEIAAAMASLEWTPVYHLYFDLNFTSIIKRSEATLATSAPVNMYIDQRYSVTPSASVFYLDQDRTATIDNMFTLANLYSDPRTYRFRITASAVNNITGWTKTGNIFEKIATGSQLVTAIQSLQITTAESVVTEYNFMFQAYRLLSDGITYGPLLVNEYPQKSILLDDRYSYTPAASPTLAYGTTSIVNMGSINNWFADQTEIQVTIGSTPAVTISGNPVTGNLAAINDYLAAVTITPDAFNRTSVQFNVVVKIKNDSNEWVQCVATTAFTASIVNLPAIAYTFDPYYVIGGESSLGMTVTNTIASQTYVLKIEEAGTGLFGNDSSLNTPTNDWSYSAPSYVTGQLSTADITNAITDITLVTRSDSVLGESATNPTIRYSLTPWTTIAGPSVVLPWKTIKNGALINVNTFEPTWTGSNYSTNPLVYMMPAIAYYSGPVSTTLNLGSYVQANDTMYLDENTEHSITVQFLGSFYSYNAPGYGTGNLVYTPLTISGWSDLGSATYGINGLPSALNSALSSMTFNNSTFLTLMWQGLSLQYIDCVIKTSNAGSGVIATQTVRLLVRTIV